MSPRPSIPLGSYVRTKPYPTRIRCKAYTAPYPDGLELRTIDCNTCLGPVEKVLHTWEFCTIYVREYWINIWAAAGGGVDYARLVDDRELAEWYAAGWKDL